MGMVFCRGCGKEIHETAPACPHCGAPQAVPAAADGKRSIGKLIGWGLVWTFVFWTGSLFIAGMIVGALNPDDAYAAGGRAGETLGGVFFLLAVGVSVALTVAGKLPGTKKPSSAGLNA